MQLQLKQGRFALAVVAILAVALLAGCGGSDESSSGSAETDKGSAATGDYALERPWGTFELNDGIREGVQQKLANGDPLDIPVFSFTTSGEFFVPFKSGMEDAAKEFGTTSELLGPVDSNQATEIADIQSYLIRDPDAVSAVFADVGAAGGTINSLIDQGIPMVVWNVDAPETKRLAYIGSSNEAMGEKAGEIMASKLKDAGIDSGEIALFANDAAAEYAKARAEGFEKKLSESLPDVSLATPVTVGGDVSGAIGKVDAAMRGAPDTVAMYCVDELVVACGTWAKQQGNADLPIVGHNLLMSELELVASGYVDALVGQNPYKQGYLTVKYLATYLKDGKPFTSKEIIDTGTPVVESPEQAEEMIATECDAKGCG